jgi:hypothetical protein
MSQEIPEKTEVLNILQQLEPIVVHYIESPTCKDKLFARRVLSKLRTMLEASPKKKK